MKGEEMQAIVAEAKKNRFATVPKLTDEDVSYVWDSVSEFIGKTMRSQKGVAIPTLGVFTFSQRKLDVGNNKFILIQRPVFMLSEKFAMIHALKTTKYHTDGQIPIVPLNFSAISHEMDLDRDTVEGCVKEMLQALSRSVQSKKTVEFTFPSIGRLTIKDSKVKTRFYKDFLQEIDGSGALINAMKNRPETSDSVLSRSMTPLGRPSTSLSTIYLPRINPGEELDEGGNKDKSSSSKKQSLMPVINEEINAAETDMDDLKLVEVSPRIEKEKIEKEKFVLKEKMSPEKRPHSPMRLKTAPEKPLSSSGLLQPDIGMTRNEVTFDQSNMDRIKLRTASRPSPRALKSIPKSAFGDDEKEKDSDSFVPVKKMHKTKAVDKTCSNCLHEAGQELCYLCYQRERRNVPVYLHEERRKKELEEDRLLQQYQHIKDYEAILKDLDRKAGNRAEAQKIAAFNLGVSEALKSKKAERPTDFHRSFMFHKRSVSPPFSLSQHQYNQDLADQVKQRDKALAQSRKEKDFLERLEQVQLAEDLAAQREQYLRNKRLQSEEYKKSLDTQMRFRPLPIPGAYPDAEQPYFGKNDMHHGKMIEKRVRARKLYEDQVCAAAEKKRNAILNDLRTQKEESLMLTRAKTDLLEETITRNRERVKIRRDLEDTWLHASKKKHEREYDDKVRAQSPGILLHEQCDKYRRCKECKRKMPNCGESNVWCESRYLSGSRIMV